jgi:hypothetical protein
MTAISPTIPTEFFEIRLAFSRLDHGISCSLIYVVRHRPRVKNMRIQSRGKAESNIENERITCHTIEPPDLIC